MTTTTTAAHAAAIASNTAADYDNEEKNRAPSSTSSPSSSSFVSTMKEKTVVSEQLPLNHQPAPTSGSSSTPQPRQATLEAVVHDGKGSTMVINFQEKVVVIQGVNYSVNVLLLRSRLWLHGLPTWTVTVRLRPPTTTKTKSRDALHHPFQRCLK
jgi:hypothetical protein